MKEGARALYEAQRSHGERMFDGWTSLVIPLSCPSVLHVDPDSQLERILSCRTTSNMHLHVVGNPEPSYWP